MDLWLQFMLFIIFGIVGFITHKIWGINIYKIVSDIGVFIFITSLLFFVFPILTDPNIATKNLEKMIAFFIESLPSMIIGDIAGGIVSKFIGR